MQEAGEKRYLQLIELEELQLESFENSRIFKEKTKRWHDKRIEVKKLQVGQKVLLFNSRLKIFPGKLKSRWMGPYTITEIFPYGAVEIEDDKKERFKVNGQRLKIFWEINDQKLKEVDSAFSAAKGARYQGATQQVTRSKEPRSVKRHSFLSVHMARTKQTAKTAKEGDSSTPSRLRRGMPPCVPNPNFSSQLAKWAKRKLIPKNGINVSELG
ncbi:hypothetical protein QYF36_010276 [Acer negundo]|nr:hypothetical protein QYF36_010276 [Acer negundo]